MRLPSLLVWMGELLIAAVEQHRETPGGVENPVPAKFFPGNAI